ncbi:MAG: L,D-transpeptidase [Pseudomonadota bacterium]
MRRYIRGFFPKVLMVLALVASGSMVVPSAADASVIAKINLSQQRMQVIVDGEVMHSWKVSSGRSGYTTPTGTWRPLRMHTMWRSRTYNNAPMPHAIFFQGGYAIHATNALSRLGSPASHGCIRLHPDHARELFSLVKDYGPNKTRIQVTR